MSASIRFGVFTVAVVCIGLLVNWTYLQHRGIANVSVVDERVIAFTEISAEHQPDLMPSRDQLLNGELRDQRALGVVQRSALRWLVAACASGIAIACWWLYRAVWLARSTRRGRPPA